MKSPILCTTIVALLTALTATTGFTKDKKKDKDKDSVVYVDRDGRQYTIDRDGKRHWIDDGRHHDDHDYRASYNRDYRSSDHGYSHDRSRTIFVIERDRPVERVVYMDPDGRYYRFVDGRRVYVQERYYESYPSKYYYPDGRRRSGVTITVPF